MIKAVTIVDYGIGNIYNVKRAFEFCGAEVNISSSADEILNASALILPGVGAFHAGMEGLRKNNLDKAITQVAKRGIPLLGICLGMQLLFEESLEFGSHQGLGLIPGKILPIKPQNDQERPMKVPHIGWTKLVVRQPAPPLFQYQEEALECYFLHSFTAFPTHEANRLADAYYGNFLISAMVKHDNIYGCQFHPEKSGKVGLSILRGFLNL